MRYGEAAAVAARAATEMSPAGRRVGARLRWAVLCFAGALAALVPAALEAQSEARVSKQGSGWTQESVGALAGGRTLQISHFVGSVVVVAGGAEGSYQLRLHSGHADEAAARRQFAGFHLGVGRNGSELLMQPVGRTDVALRAELIVHLHPGIQAVHVDTLAGKITVRGDVEKLDLRTHGGDIELDNAKLLRAMTMGGSVTVNHRVVNSQIRTGGGDIRVDASTGDLLISSLGGNIYLNVIARGQVETEGGNIQVVRSMGTLRVRTAGGNIRLGQMDGDVWAESGGGNIFVGVAHGEVSAKTRMGNIDLWKLYRAAHAQTGMGRITAEFVGDRREANRSQLVTSMGNVVVYFQGGAASTFRGVAANCPSRRIISEFPDVKTVAGLPQYGPHSVAVEGLIHGGGPEIEARTTVGHIELRHAK